MGNELLAFFEVAKMFDRLWLDGIKMRIYVRMEASQCKELGQTHQEQWVDGPRLNICSVEYFNPDDWEVFGRDWFISFCEFAHRHNPWNATFIESIDKPTARILFEQFGWKAEIQPACLFKGKLRLPDNHFWGDEPCTKNTEE